MEGGKLVVSLIVLLKIVFFSAHMMQEVLLKISYLLPVAYSQLYPSNGEDWVRMLEIRSPESDGENIYCQSQFEKKI